MVDTAALEAAAFGVEVQVLSRASWLKYLIMAEDQLITEKDLLSLFEMVNRLKMRELFEEPSSFEDEPED